jgi:hypothetical protein
LLSALGPAQEEIRAALQNLLERKFVLRDGERLLSLICEPGQLVFNVAPPFPGGRVLVAASGAAQSEAAC